MHLRRLGCGFDRAHMIWFRKTDGLGRGLISAEPQASSRTLGSCSEFVVACRNATTVLDLVEELLDLIPRAIEILAEADRNVAIGARWNVGPHDSSIGSRASF